MDVAMCHAEFGALEVVSKLWSSLNALVFVHSLLYRSKAPIVYGKLPMDAVASWSPQKKFS